MRTAARKLSRNAYVAAVHGLVEPSKRRCAFHSKPKAGCPPCIVAAAARVADLDVASKRIAPTR